MAWMEDGDGDQSKESKTKIEDRIQEDSAASLLQ